MKKIWRQVIYRDVLLPFEVSNYGNVRRIPGKDAKGRMRGNYMISQHVVGSGYIQVTLKANHRKYAPLVHALVALAFLPSPPGGYGRGKIAVNHKNGIKTDNRATNLEWVTYQQNSKHAKHIGLILSGERHPSAVLTEEQVRQVRSGVFAGISERNLAKRFNCTRGAISGIKRGKTWKHIKN